MKIIRTPLIIAACLFSISCEKIVKVDLETAPPRLVIDASIHWFKNTPGTEQVIKLSTTTGYYSDNFPVVSGAAIVITNSTNTHFEFIESLGTGIYRCKNFLPVVGETYMLNILLNGETYTATETLLAAPDIDDNIEQNNKGGMAGDEIEITYYYRDNAVENNYYLYSNRSPRVAFPQYQLEDDDDVQGGRVPVYYSHKDLKPGDIVNIELHGISKRYYNYFRKLLNASGNDDGPFATTPVSVQGNIQNKTNSDNYAFGYFSVSQVTATEYTVK